MTYRNRTVALVFALCVLGPACAVGDVLPSQPIALADGHLVIGGQASVSIAPSDPGYFNYTDYGHNNLRLVRLALTTAFHVAAHLSLLGEIQTENLDAPHLYALYLRLRPWAHRAFDIQAGRIPPVFGAYARRPYDADNLLIGTPLAYQYLTALRPDALPATADDLLRMRGRGWSASFPIGSTQPAPGVPLVAALRWDTGVEVRLGDRPVSVNAAVTTGTLSDPRVADNNGGPQVSGRIELRPTPGLILGVSGASGPFVASAAADALPGGVARRGLTQQAWGVDAEYSVGYWLVRGEAIVSRWHLPAAAAPFLTDPLQAVSVFAEGRYRIRPDLYLAARIDHLGFSQVTGTLGRESWDAPVSRVELGGGYRLQRNLLLKLAWQHDSRDSRFGRTASLVAAQLSFWF